MARLIDPLLKYLAKPVHGKGMHNDLAAISNMMWELGWSESEIFAMLRQATDGGGRNRQHLRSRLPEIYVNARRKREEAGEPLVPRLKAKKFTADNFKQGSNSQEPPPMTAEETERYNKKVANEAIIRRLAAMDMLEYEKVRDDEAKALGSRPAVLDKLVTAERRRLAGAGGQRLQGQEMNLREIEPWSKPVNGAEVLNQIVNVLNKYMVMPEGAAEVVALWCAHTHIYEVWKCTPRLNITSPESDCGKTTLILIISPFVPRPLLAEVLTEATIFRTVEKYRPTILADEYNNWLDGRPEVMAVLNGGHRRGVMVPRCVGEDHEPRLFNVFAPAVLCGIGPLPDQLHSRCIVIHLEKARPGEIREDFDEEQAEEETEELGRKLARFCADNKAAFKDCKVVMPPGVGGTRPKDNWRSLFQIAQMAGEDWPQRLNAAVSGLTRGTHAESTGTRLLTDIREIFENNPIVVPLFSSVTLVKLLNEMEDRGWKDHGHLQKGITTYQLSLLLKPYQITPKKERYGRDTLRGYRVSDFKEVFEHYLPPLEQPELPIQ